MSTTELDVTEPGDNISLDPSTSTEGVEPEAPRAAPASARVAQWLSGLTRLESVLLGLSAVLLVTALVFVVQVRTGDASATANRALLDKRQTSGVAEVVSRQLAQVLSYDHQNPEATRAFADQYLSGQARDQYDTLFESLQQRAPGQKLVLTAQVQVAGVQQLSDTKAEVLVFLDQSSTRATDQQATVSAAQVAITAERKGNTWTITGLKPL